MKFISFLLVLTLSACSHPDAVDSKGNPFYLSDCKGKWLIVSYWANWCEPCLKELPELDAFYRTHSEKVLVLGVSFDNISNQKMEQLATQWHIHFPLLREFPLRKFNVTQLDTLPATLVISPHGKLITILYGPQTQTSLKQITGTIK